MPAPIVVAVVSAVEAYQKYKAEQDNLNWQADVSDSLSRIEIQLANIAAGIQQLQEAVSKLPGQIAQMLQDTKVNEVKGWTTAAMETLAVIQSQVGGMTAMSAAQISALWDLASHLGANEGTLEAGYEYAAYGVSIQSFLTRIGIYRALMKNKGERNGAVAAFQVAVQRKLAWLDSGVDISAAATGPGKALTDRQGHNLFVEPIFQSLENRRGIRVGWLEFDSNYLLVTNGSQSNKHLKISQPRLAGDRSLGFSAPDPWEIDSAFLNGPTPNWGAYVDLPWWPARRLFPAFTGSINAIGYNAREQLMAELERQRRTYNLYSATILILAPIVDDLHQIRDEIAKLTVN